MLKVGALMAAEEREVKRDTAKLLWTSWRSFVTAVFKVGALCKCKCQPSDDLVFLLVFVLSDDCCGGASQGVGRGAQGGCAARILMHLKRQLARE